MALTTLWIPSWSVSKRFGSGMVLFHHSPAPLSRYGPICRKPPCPFAMKDQAGGATRLEKPPPPSGAPSLGKESTAHRFAGNFLREAAPIPTRRDHGKEA